MNYSLRSVAEKVRSLQSASATNDKIALLKEYLQDNIFRRCFVAAYSESTDFKKVSYQRKMQPGISAFLNCLKTLSF